MRLGLALLLVPALGLSPSSLASHETRRTPESPALRPRIPLPREYQKKTEVQNLVHDLKQAGKPTLQNDAWWAAARRLFPHRNGPDAEYLRRALTDLEYSTLGDYEDYLRAPLSESPALDISLIQLNPTEARAFLDHPRFRVLKTLSEICHLSPYLLAPQIDLLETDTTLFPSSVVRRKEWERLLAQCFARKNDRELKLARSRLRTYRDGDRNLNASLSELVELAIQSRNHALKSTALDFPWRGSTAPGFLEELRQQTEAETKLIKLRNAGIAGEKTKAIWERVGEKLASGEFEEAVAWAKLVGNSFTREKLLLVDANDKVKHPGLTIRGVFRQ